MRTESEPEAGIAAALSNEHQLVVLDVMMPRVSGIEALARIRAQSRVPVLMLTAKGDDADRIVGSRAGRGRLRAEALHAARAGGTHPRDPAKDARGRRGRGR